MPKTNIVPSDGDIDLVKDAQVKTQMAEIGKAVETAYPTGVYNLNEGEVPGEGLTTTVSISQKIGLPNYGSAEVFISIQGVNVTHTPDDIDAMLAQSKIVYNQIAAKIQEKVKGMSVNKGVVPEEDI